MEFLKTTLLIALSLALPGTNNLLAADERQSTTDVEIEFLLAEVATSGCVFIRNNDKHPADEAVSHLRMKYRNGKRYVSSTEDFVNRIASKSSWSGKPYQILCPGIPVQPSGEWLTEKLVTYRAK